MDPLSALLRGPQATDAFVLRVVMEPPWAIEVRDRAPLTIAAVISGEALVTPEHGEPQLLKAGHIGIIGGPDTYRFTDRQGSPTQVIIHPGQYCEDASGTPMAEPFMRGVRTWGNDPDGSVVMLIGTYENVGMAGSHLLSSLPSLAMVDAADIELPVVQLMEAELTREGPGQIVVLDRLLDLLTVATLRTWFDQAGAEAPPWWQASSDPVAGHAITLLCNNPAHPWTVASLAQEVGVSRANLARRFSDLVGEAPMSFLTNWRIALAADLLLTPDATVAGVAHQVGYGSGFALSTAFKRLRGMSPTQFRAEALAA